MRGELGGRIDRLIDEVQKDIFYGGNVRSWHNGKTTVFLPSPNGDVIFVFTHILQHFFRGGIGLRQICDWCRLLWTYKDSLDRGLLESRIKKAGIMSEWKAFGVLAIEYLGIPEDSMPLLNVNDAHNANLRRMADGIMELVLENGNFGHNKDLSYRVKFKGFKSKLLSLWRRLCDFWRFATIFPMDAPLFFVTYVLRKVQ